MPLDDSSLMRETILLMIWIQQQLSLHLRFRDIIYMKYLVGFLLLVKALKYIFTQKELNVRHRPQLELLKDYDLQIQYHMERQMLLIDALSRKTRHGLNIVIVTQMSFLKELESMGVQLVSHGQASVQLSTLTLQLSLVEEIRANQETNLELQRIKQNLIK